MRYALIFAAALGAAANAAHGQCSPSFNVETVSVNVDGVQVGNGNFATESFNVDLDNQNAESCDIRLRITRSGNVDPDMPAYFLSAAGNQVEILAYGFSVGTVLSDVLLTLPGGDESISVPFAVRLPTEWGLAAGDYVDNLRVSLVAPGEETLDSLDVAVNIDIPKEVSVRLVGASGEAQSTATVNLGVLSTVQQTRSDPFGVRVWSTAPYTVGFSSSNRGRLVHTNGIDAIPYVMSVGGSEVDLTGVSSYYFARHTSSLGDIHGLSIVVDPVQARAGDYSDSVTVSVTAS
ncbi:MAG: hypothetical protein ACXWUP_00910 [Allosphingosinicella sp.]